MRKYSLERRASAGQSVTDEDQDLDAAIRASITDQNPGDEPRRRERVRPTISEAVQGMVDQIF